MEHTQILSRYMGTFVAELADCGVRHVVVSPGSRSTPLALLLAEHPQIKVWMHMDERSAAFFALGMAKTGREAVALLCSSGTAVANYLPAVVEACYARVPLIVLTADRPHELRAVGAPQTIDQLGIFGSFVKLFIELAEPADAPDLLRYVNATARRAVGTAIAGPSGPVHLNFPLREPLLPDLALASASWLKERSFASPQVIEGKRQLGVEQARAIAKEVRAFQKGLIVCGPLDAPDFAEAVMALANILGYPVLADPLSQVRSGRHSKKQLVDTYDTFLRDGAIADALVPDLVIRFGSMPVSKALFQYLKKNTASRQMVVDEAIEWRDPTLAATEVIYSEPVGFCQSIAKELISSGERQAGTSSWMVQWQSINQAARVSLYEQSQAENDAMGQLFITLTESLPDQAMLVAGNSMPIRDLDTFFFVQEHSLRIMANRGANGIDGVVSTALGAAAFTNPCVLVVGDLSFYHDLNGLLAAKLHKLNVTILLINNDGGGIFSFLPQAALPEHFETLFGTPLGLDFKQVVEMYQGRFIRLESGESFQSVLKECLTLPGLKVIEVEINRSENVENHKKLWAQAAKAARQAILNLA